MHSNFVERETPAFITPALWPPNSPDFIPLDYKILEILQQQIYQTKLQDVKDLMQRLMDVRGGMEHSATDIDHWRTQLNSVNIHCDAY